MRALAFFALILGQALVGPVSKAQTPAPGLTPLQARMIPASEGEDSWLELRLQLSEELAQNPLLHCEILNSLGNRVYDFELPTGRPDHSIRFSLKLPRRLFSEGLYLLVLRGFDSALRPAMERSVRLTLPKEGSGP